MAVPFDISCGVCVICVMRKSTYREKLEDAINADLFQKLNGARDEIVIKTDKQKKNIVQPLMKQGKIPDKNYQ